MTNPRNDPYGNFNFLVEIDGIVKAGFSEVSGLTAEINVIEYREGGDPITVRKLAGLRKYSNIVLKRGLTQDLALWNWFSNVAKGNVQRAAGSIILLDAARNPVLRWKFVQGWPCKWEGPHLNAKSNEIAIEELEIAHEGIELTAP